MKAYLVTAEHSNGKSVGHPCVTGVYSDPTDGFELITKAVNEEEARKQGINALARKVEQSSPCDCRRHLAPGSCEWWESLAVWAGEIEP